MFSGVCGAKWPFSAKKWRPLKDSNLRLSAPEADALSPELRGRLNDGCRAATRRIDGGKPSRKRKRADRTRTAHGRLNSLSLQRDCLDRACSGASSALDAGVVGLGLAVRVDRNSADGANGGAGSATNACIADSHCHFLPPVKCFSFFLRFTEKTHKMFMAIAEPCPPTWLSVVNPNSIILPNGQYDKKAYREREIEHDARPAMHRSSHAQRASLPISKRARG